MLLLLLRSFGLAAMAERFDDVCELGELSGGDMIWDLHQREQSILDKYKTKYSKDWESK